MPKKKFTEEQIAFTLRQADAGTAPRGPALASNNLHDHYPL
jgi:hypothetical protein